ncbi:aliphatic sulfonate ABC transporter substrate-binding protein [Nostoc sp.]|uniref:aliphatic sulfonate ABC transporter substrate-binding protein n=1 Tax=Nostoc sp. TaxID=1180 RepID=UPI002FFCBC18
MAVYALREQKLLEKAFAGQSTNFEFRRLLSLKPVAEALSANALDLGLGGTPVAAIASGQPIRVIALVERSPKTHALLVLPNSPIKTIADLKGKKLGNPSGKSYYFAGKVLERAGLKDTDIKWVQIENDAGRAALLSGAIDVWGTWDPFYASAEVAKEVVPLVDGEGYQLNYVALFGRIDYIEKNPEVVQKFLKAYKQAITWAKDNRQAAVNILVKENKLSPEAASLTLGRRNLIFEPPNDEYRQELINQSQLFARLGLIKQQPNWDKAIDTTLAKTIAAS